MEHLRNVPANLFDDALLARDLIALMPSWSEALPSQVEHAEMMDMGDVKPPHLHKAPLRPHSPDVDVAPAVDRVPLAPWNGVHAHPAQWEHAEMADMGGVNVPLHQAPLRPHSPDVDMMPAVDPVDQQVGQKLSELMNELDATVFNHMISNGQVHKQPKVSGGKRRALVPPSSSSSASSRPVKKRRDTGRIFGAVSITSSNLTPKLSLYRVHVQGHKAYATPCPRSDIHTKITELDGVHGHISVSAMDPNAAPVEQYGDFVAFTTNNDAKVPLVLTLRGQHAYIRHRIYNKNDPEDEYVTCVGDVPQVPITEVYVLTT